MTTYNIADFHRGLRSIVNNFLQRAKPVVSDAIEVAATFGALGLALAALTGVATLVSKGLLYAVESANGQYMLGGILLASLPALLLVD